MGPADWQEKLSKLTSFLRDHEKNDAASIREKLAAWTEGNSLLTAMLDRFTFGELSELLDMYRRQSANSESLLEILNTKVDQSSFVATVQDWHSNLITLKPGPVYDRYKADFDLTRIQ
jgi:hypothetical protein